MIPQNKKKKKRTIVSVFLNRNKQMLVCVFLIVSNVETNHKTTQTNKTDVTYELTAKRMPRTGRTTFHFGMIDESKHDDPYLHPHHHWLDLLLVSVPWSS